MGKRSAPEPNDDDDMSDEQSVDLEDSTILRCFHFSIINP